jgi:hypothetical protein
MGGVVNRLHNGGGKYVPKVRTLGGAAPYKGGASFGSYAEKRKLKLFSTIEVINGINSNVYELIR